MKRKGGKARRVTIQFDRPLRKGGAVQIGKREGPRCGRGHGLPEANRKATYRKILDGVKRERTKRIEPDPKERRQKRCSGGVQEGFVPAVQGGIR